MRRDINYENTDGSYKRRRENAESRVASYVHNSLNQRFGNVKNGLPPCKGNRESKSDYYCQSDLLPKFFPEFAHFVVMMMKKPLHSDSRKN